MYAEIRLSHPQFPSDLQNSGLLNLVEFAQFGNGGVVPSGNFAESVTLSHSVILWRTAGGTAGSAGSAL